MRTLQSLAVLLLVVLGSSAAVYADTVNIGPAKGCFSPSGNCTSGEGTTAQYDTNNINLLYFNNHNPSGVNIHNPLLLYRRSRKVPLEGPDHHHPHRHLHVNAYVYGAS